MEKLLLIGGYGFVGKNIIEQLHGKYDIIIIDKNQDHEFTQKYPNVKFVQYVFLEDRDIKKIISVIDPDYIINLVSIVTADRDLNQFKKMIDINLEVLLELYEASKNCANMKLFLQFGSGEEYGNIESPIKETDREYPSSPYALSKQLTTNTALMLHRNFRFPISVVRPSNLFGEYQDSRKFIPYIVEKLRVNENIETTLGEQKRDFIYIKDFVTGIEKVLKSYEHFIGEIFNLSSGFSFKLNEIIQHCKNYLKSTSNINYGGIAYRENEMMNFELDISKFEKLTSENYKIDVIKSLCLYMDRNGDNCK
jgi:UDP-glucose 4-epimerase